jgi:thiol-disulfide isomerase/thioredoxin
MTRGHWTATVGAALLAGVVVGAVALARRDAAPARSSESAGLPATGRVTPATSGRGIRLQFSDRPVPVPSFSLATLDGRTISPADWAGKVVLVNFWATWCRPCRQEIPALVALQERYRDTLLIVGLSIDEGPPSDVKQFAEQYHLNYPIAIADAKLTDAFGGVPAVPSTYVVNTTGGIVQRYVGALDPASSEHTVRALAGLATEAQVEIVHDLGQVLLANVAYATEIPGVDLSGLTPVQKDEALRRLKGEKCTCGCGLTLAKCRISDPTCAVSPGVADKLVKKVASGG